MDKLTNFQNNIFNVIIFITYISYFALAIGIFNTKPEYLSVLSFFVKIYVCIFLVLRFNPFRKVIFSELDRKIVFTSALFLITESINDVLMKYIKQINEIKKEVIYYETQ